MKNCQASSLKAIRMSWEIFCIISETAEKFLANGPGKVLPSSPLVASQSYLRWFPPPPLPFLLKDWDRSWTGNTASCSYWRTVFLDEEDCLGEFLRVSPKGLTLRRLVRVFGPRGCDGIQRWLVREISSRMCWRRRRLLFGGLVSALPFVENSGDELDSYLLRVLLPFLHIACVGTKDVATSDGHHQETVLISLREVDRRRF